MQAGWKSVMFAVGNFAAAAVSQATAQNAPPPSSGGPVTGARPKRTLEGVTEMRRLTQLKLTDDQIMKLRPIVNDEGVQLSAVGLDEHLTRDQRRQRIQQIRDQFRPKITAILTPEQQEEWKQMEEGKPEDRAKLELRQRPLPSSKKACHPEQARTPNAVGGPCVSVRNPHTRHPNSKVGDITARVGTAALGCQVARVYRTAGCESTNQPDGP